MTKNQVVQWWLGAVVICCLMPSGVVRAADAGATTQPSAQELVQQLSGDAYKAREEAQRR